MTRFIVIGLFQGAVYGLLAVGIVLVYKGTRVFNFAQGEFGTIGAFVAWAVITQTGIPYLLAVVLGLLVAVVSGLVIERVVVRPLLQASRLTLLVATVGVALFIISVTVLLAQPETRTMPPLLGGGSLNILGAGISPQQIVVPVVLGGIAIALAWFFSNTNLGLGILGTSQDQLAARVVGISPQRMSRFIWGFAALLGGIAGILQAPIGIFHPGFMTAVTLVPAFTAAVLGGMTSLPGAFLGGELVGVAQNVGIYLLGQQLNVPGASELTMFVLLVAVLAVRPSGILGKEA